MIRRRMHVLFLAPDTHVYNHGFLRALKGLGAKVSAIGVTGAEKLAPAARHLRVDHAAGGGQQPRKTDVQ